jgi:hypothetical protein
MPVTRTASEPEQHVEVHSSDGGVVLAVEGYLDETTGEELVKSTAAAVEEQTARLDIDLSACTGYTDEGAGSLVACRELCSDLPDGLHYRTTPGPGQEALLSAYQDAEEGAGAVDDSDLA